MCVPQTSEAERIGINQIAKVLPRGNDKASDQCESPSSAAQALGNSMHTCAAPVTECCGPAVTAHYTSLHAAIKMLHSRLAILHGLLAKMSLGGHAAALLRFAALMAGNCYMRSSGMFCCPKGGCRTITPW